MSQQFGSSYTSTATGNGGGSETPASIRDKYESNLGVETFSTDDKKKLDAITSYELSEDINSFKNSFFSVSE